MTTQGLSTLVVIPTLNEAANIVRVLGEVSDGLGDDARLCVVDGGSDDGTRDLVTAYAGRDRRVFLLDNPARIQSAGINLAATRFGADFDVLVRCDAHSFYPPRFVDTLLSTLQAQGATSVVVPMDSEGRTCAGRATAWVSDTIIGSGGSRHRAGLTSGFVDHGHHAAFRMSDYLAVGGYDETFSHNEDAELDCRLRAHGGRIYLEAAARIGYRVRDSFAKLARQYLNYGRGRARTVARHPSSLRLRQMAVPAGTSAITAALLISPWWWPALAVPALYVALLAAVSVQLAWRRRSPCGLLAGVAAAVMHFSWSWGFITGSVTARRRAVQPPGSLTAITATPGNSRVASARETAD